MHPLSARKIRELREMATSGGSGKNKVGRAIELSGETQLAIADATGLPQPYISDVARNRYETITVDNARKFADYFGCTIEDLFPAREELAS